MLIPVKEGLVCKGQRCVGNQCSITSDQYCFDTVSEDQQGGTTYCAAEYTYNGTTWTPNWKQCWNSSKETFLLCTTFCEANTIFAKT